MTKATFDLKWAEKAGRTDFRECFFRLIYEGNAGIAQLVEQLICNQQVVGSNPTAGSIVNRGFSRLQRVLLGHFLAIYLEHPGCFRALTESGWQNN